MKKWWIIPLLIIALVPTVVVFLMLKKDPAALPMILQPTPVPTPLTVYSFDSLSRTSFPAVPITLGRVVSENPDSLAQLFSFTFSPRPGSDEKKTVSGVINVPKKPGTYPVILMMRGYISPETYKPGAGTQPSATVYAKNGFITIAPDFLGFGESDSKADDQYESRFQTYTTALTLLSSTTYLPAAMNASYSGTIVPDISKVGLWGHSNGGHIALSLLAISKAKIPTVLWAPVSKSFPYSVLYYTDEEDDQGKMSRKDLSRFETLYDTDLFSPPNYYDRIQAPISIYQGSSDEEVPVWWTTELVKNLKKTDHDVTLTVFPGADHNLRPAWNDVVLSNIEFYKKSFASGL